jgi:hypothetical protein
VRFQVPDLGAPIEVQRGELDRDHTLQMVVESSQEDVFFGHGWVSARGTSKVLTPNA